MSIAGEAIIKGERNSRGGKKKNLVAYGTPISSTRSSSSYDVSYAFDGLINTNFRSSASATNCYVGMDFGAGALGALAFAPLTSEPYVFKSVLTCCCPINVQVLAGRP